MLFVLARVVFHLCGSTRLVTGTHGGREPVGNACSASLPAEPGAAAASPLWAAGHGNPEQMGPPWPEGFKPVS